VTSSSDIVLVTGAGKRLGQSIALALAAAGYSIAVHYSASSTGADETVAQAKALGVNAQAFQADLGDEQSTSGLIDRISSEFGVPKAVVNSASAFQFDAAESFQYQAFADLMRINTAAPVMLARQLYAKRKAMPPAEAFGVVVNLLDQKLFNPTPDYFSYSLSKAALQFATIMLAQALAPTLRVVGIAPGITLPSGDQTQEEFEAAHRLTPLGHSSRPEDIASAVLFALHNPAITGTTLLVDGGQHLVSSARDVMFKAK
jgi:NAD(P)-dependent dehydrogenase (short-subunit alcohol dehydrogenase family)